MLINAGICRNEGYDVATPDYARKIGFQVLEEEESRSRTLFEESGQERAAFLRRLIQSLNQSADKWEFRARCDAVLRAAESPAPAARMCVCELIHIG